MNDQRELYEINLEKYDIEKNYDKIVEIVSKNFGFEAYTKASFGNSKDMKNALNELERLIS